LGPVSDAEANKETLGFGERTAQRLTSLAANRSPATDLDVEQASSALNEQLTGPSCWGKDEKARAFADVFWPTYPRKVGKAAAEKAFLKRAASPEEADRIISALRAQLPTLAADVQYCPHPATWLNNKRDEDELPAPPGVTPGDGLKTADEYWQDQ
jgi:hypothetical protein